jgi:two-component system, LytTR family, sensor kinase
MTQTIIKILSYRWLWHLAFLMVMFADGYFGNRPYMETDALHWHVGVSMILNIIVVYLNVGFLYSRLFAKGKILEYTLVLLLVVIVFSFITMYLYEQKGDILKVTSYRYFFFRFSMVTALSTGAKFFRSGIYNLFALRQMKQQQQVAEAQLLQSQVAPHFLHNTLNNLYSLVLHRSPVAPEAMLQLAQLMQYLTLNAGKLAVPLQQEVTYLKNYIALEKLRLNENASIRFQVSGDIANARVAPLLLLPFIENSFKHGVEQMTNNIYVEILIVVQGNTIFFQVTNGKPVPAPGQTAHKISDGGSINAKKRLDLIYPGKHELFIQEEPTFYSVKLNIDLC